MQQLSQIVAVGPLAYHSNILSNGSEMGWRDLPQRPVRESMPYMQIAADRWVVIRESMERPKAIIQLVTARDQTEKYFLFTWHLDPTKRRLHGMYDTLEEANREVPWPRPNPKVPGMPDHLRQPNPNARSAQARHHGAGAPPTL